MRNKAFQSELAYLRRRGQEFGQAHPGLAGALAQESSDPDVERLLEGFAFLTARIRERADDCVPEMAHELAEMLLPRYVRPLPATTVVAFDIDPKAVAGSYTLPRGTSLVSRAIDKTTCKFETTHDCVVLPLYVTGASLRPKQEGRYSLALTFALPEAYAFEVFRHGRVRLFFGQDYAQASNLWLAVLRHTARLYAELDGERVPLDPTRIVAPAFVGEDATSGYGDDPTQAIQDYFHFAQQFLFVDVGGLDALVGYQVSQFRLIFELEDAPKIASPLPPDAVRINCAVAKNLFTEGAIPLRQQTFGQEHLLRANGIDAAHVEVYDVTAVTGIAAKGGARTHYPSFASFLHLSGTGDGAYWRLRRELSQVDGAVDTYLSLLSPHKSAVLKDGEEVLGVELRCTNRWLPAKLRRGDLSLSRTLIAPLLATNIIDVAPPQAPPLGQEIYWKLLSHLGLRHRELTDVASLRQALTNYHLQDQQNARQARIHAQRLEGVHELTRKKTYRMAEGVPFAGYSYTLSLQENNYASRGDLVLLGYVIEATLTAAQPVNGCSSLQAVLLPSKQTYAWEARGF